MTTTAAQMCDEILGASRGDTGFARGAFYALSVFVCKLVGITFFECRAFHSERIPARGPALLASVHQSWLDPWMVGMIPERSSCYLAKEELFRVPLLGWLIRTYHSFPVPREKVAPKKVFEVALAILAKGRSLILFPEGTRSSDGRLQPLRRGIELIARRSGAPVVPVFVRGAFRCWPRGRRLPRPGRVDIIFGEPIVASSSDSASEDPKPRDLFSGKSSGSFVERLSRSYRDLAIEVGAPEAVAGGPFSRSAASSSKELASLSPSHGELPAPPQPEDGCSCPSLTTNSGPLDGSLATREA